MSLTCPECGRECVECAAILIINWDVNLDGPVERNIDGREGHIDPAGAAWCCESECLWSGAYTDLVLDTTPRP